MDKDRKGDGHGFSRQAPPGLFQFVSVKEQKDFKTFLLRDISSTFGERNEAE